MAHLIWSPDAINDLERISDYISFDSERYASVVVTRIIYRINAEDTVDILRVFHQAQEFNMNLD
ncbi:type II toxin-antitoxin system RelE/ParE family toxin [Caldalkalibacillus mannanilyticus]|uniref:type II toxin-antitoxin system RelE/ParE family toxin n=1 Tax=Caldalkalibacillus mannanilyticus TaxID=1418 RepID=UPI00046AC36B|nr:type II toxin-antitoxin system RelE/ParE family toxin [Caldalkalibacillus mannanilyticus]